jgi:hypothetical protein
MRRTFRGVKVTQAHREHYYQRLIQMRWGHGKVALAEYSLMFLVGVSALCFLRSSFPWILILAWGVIYTWLILLIDMRWNRFIRGENA